VLRHPQIEVFRQFEGNANRAVKCYRLHRGEVAQLGDISPKGKLRLEKKENVPGKGAIERLELDVAAEQIARVRRAAGSHSAGTSGLRKSAATEVWFIVRWSDFKVRVASHPIVRKPGSSRGPFVPGRRWLDFWCFYCG